MIANKYHGLSRHQELTVTSLNEAAMIQAFKSGMSVVVDNTNLRSADVKSLYKIANDFGVSIRVHDMDLFTLEEIIENDKTREKSVGEDVIRGFYTRYFRKGKYPPVPENTPESVLGKPYTPNPDLPKAVWVDLDGTLAEREHDDAPQPVRGPFDEHRVGEDAVIEHVADLVRVLHKDGYKIIAMSGRTDGCQQESEDWLKKNNIPYDEIFMRRTELDAGRKDCYVKHDLFWEFVAPKYDVRFCLDDRQQVVDFTRDVLRIPVLQVAPGDF